MGLALSSIKSRRPLSPSVRSTKTRKRKRHGTRSKPVHAPGEVLHAKKNRSLTNGRKKKKRKKKKERKTSLRRVVVEGGGGSDLIKLTCRVFNNERDNDACVALGGENRVTMYRRE